MREFLHRIVFGNPLYDASLGSRPPGPLASMGGGLLSVHAAQMADNLSPFPAAAGAVTELGGDAFRALPLMLPVDARSAVDSRLPNLVRWTPAAWRPDVLGERISRLTDAFEMLTGGASARARAQLGRTVLRGARHLHRVPMSAPRPWRRFLTHRGRIFSALALAEVRRALARDLRALGADVDRQVLGDGGHIERSPSKALAVLALLIEIRDALAHHQMEPPAGLISAIDRMAPFIRALRMGDGELTLLGGGRAGDEDLIEAVLSASGNHGRAMAYAPHTGYCRLRSGQTTVLVDTGRGGAGDPDAHLSPLAFELCIGKMRLVTSCGLACADIAGGETWGPALRKTAAHATLVLGGQDAHPTEVHAERRDHDGARLLEGWHDGYEKAYGIRHHRALYLDAGGGDLRGEDRLSGGFATPFAIRFHLHPDVAALPVEGGQEALLKLPRGPGWRFRCDGRLDVEDSVYFGDGLRHRSRQIVIAGEHGGDCGGDHGGDTVVKWRLAMDR